MTEKEYIIWYSQKGLSGISVARIDELIFAMIQCGSNEEKARKAATEVWESLQ